MLAVEIVASFRRELRLLGVNITGCGHLGKVTANGHHPKMLGRELDLRAIPQRPGRGTAA